MNVMFLHVPQNPETVDLVEITVTKSAAAMRQHTFTGWFVSACLHVCVIYVLFNQFQVLANAPSLSGQKRVASVELVASWQAATESIPTVVKMEQVELPEPEDPQPEVTRTREAPPVQMVSQTKMMVSKQGTLPPPASTLTRSDAPQPKETQPAEKPLKIEKQITPAELSQASSKAAAPPQNAGYPDQQWKPQWSPLPYPSQSLIRQGLGGRVELIVSVGPDGKVKSVKLLRSSGYAVFDEAALASVSRWRYAPPAGSDQLAGATFKQPVVYDPRRASR